MSWLPILALGLLALWAMAEILGWMIGIALNLLWIVAVVLLAVWIWQKI